jgi:hypothetical protein
MSHRDYPDARAIANETLVGDGRIFGPTWCICGQIQGFDHFLANSAKGNLPLAQEAIIERAKVPCWE